MRPLFALLLLSSGLHAAGQAGDHDCVIQFYLGKVGADGVCTTLMDCVTWESNEATVELAPGEQVRLTRHCPGCNYCPDAQVGLQRHVGSGPGHATSVDPILDTLPLFQGTGTDIATPGSYYIRGIAPGYGMTYYWASLKLIIENVATAVEEPTEAFLHAWATPVGLALEHTPSGVLSILDMTGKEVLRTRVARNDGVQVLALPNLPIGSYVVLVSSNDTVLRQRIVIN